MVLGIISPSWCSSWEIGFRTYPNFTSLRLVLYAVIENFGYRQLNVWWRFWAIIDKIREGPSGRKTKERIRAGGRDAGDWGAEALIRRRRPARKRSAAGGTSFSFRRAILLAVCAGCVGWNLWNRFARTQPRQYDNASKSPINFWPKIRDVDVMVVYGFGMLWKGYDKSENLFRARHGTRPTTVTPRSDSSKTIHGAGDGTTPAVYRRERSGSKKTPTRVPTS